MAAAGIIAMENVGNVPPGVRLSGQAIHVQLDHYVLYSVEPAEAAREATLCVDLSHVGALCRLEMQG